MKLKKNNNILHILCGVFQVSKRGFLFLAILLFGINSYGQAVLTATDDTSTEDTPITDTATFEVDLGFINNTGAAIPVIIVRVAALSDAIAADYNGIPVVEVPDGSQTATFEIEPIDDSEVENIETLILQLNATPDYTVGTTAERRAAMTITDNDEYKPILTVSDDIATEDTPATTDTATFQVDLGYVNTTGAAIPITIVRVAALSDAVAADYNGIPVLEVPSGSQTVTFEIEPIDDSEVESLETLTLQVNASLTGDYILGTNAERRAEMTIADNDVYTASLTATDGTSTEGTPITDTATFEVDLGYVNTTGAAIPITIIRVNTSLSTAVAADYAGIPAVSVAIGSQTATFEIEPIDDSEVEILETLTLQVNASVSGDYVLGTTAERRAAMTIADNDTATLTIEDVTVNEDVASGVMVFTVTLDNAVSGGTLVSYTFVDDGATGGGVDYTATGGNLSFSGTVNEEQSISVAIINDLIVETSEDFRLLLGVPTNSGVSVSGLGEAIGTIADDDGCGITPISNGLSAEFCGDILANLNDYTNTPPPAGMTLIWSRSSNPFNVGARLTEAESEAITVEGSYFGYFYDVVNNCAGGVLEIELIKNEIPTIETVTGASSCGPDVLLLKATASTDASIKWYDSLTGGTELGTGEEYSTVNLETTTTFYVEADLNGCVSERVEVLATILSEPTPGIGSNYVACNLTSTQQPLSTVDLDNLLTGSPDVGVWSFVSGIATISINAENEVSFIAAEIGDYVFRYTTTGAVAPCTNTFTGVTITVTADCTPDPIDIEVLKSVNNENAIAGENVIFTVTLNNLSDRNVQNIIVGDLIETGFDYVLDTPSIGTYDVATGSWIINELAAMGAATLQIEVTVLSEGIYTNTAEILESFPTDNNPDNDSAVVSLTIDVPEGGDLAIEKTVRIENTENSGPRANPLAGDEVVFTIKVINLSEDVTMNQIRVLDEIKAPEFVYVSSISSSGTYDSSSGIWVIPELVSGAEAQLEITVSVPAEGVFTNVATIVGSVPLQTDSNEEENNNSAIAEVNVSLPTEADCGFVFNQFSPNGDGVNDYFKVQCIEQYRTNRLQIYDRYGNQVYIKAGYTNDWGGEGDDGQVPEGTYFYLLDLGDGSEALKGWIQLIR